MSDPLVVATGLFIRATLGQHSASGEVLTRLSTRVFSGSFM